MVVVVALTCMLIHHHNHYSWVVVVVVEEQGKGGGDGGSREGVDGEDRGGGITTHQYHGAHTEEGEDFPAMPIYTLW